MKYLIVVLVAIIGAAFGSYAIPLIWLRSLWHGSDAAGLIMIWLPIAAFPGATIGMGCLAILERHVQPDYAQLWTWLIAGGVSFVIAGAAVILFLDRFLV